MSLHTKKGAGPLMASRAKLGEASLRTLSIQLFLVLLILHSSLTFVVKKREKGIAKITLIAGVQRLSLADYTVILFHLPTTL